jgi:hypothetical protein
MIPNPLLTKTPKIEVRRRCLVAEMPPRASSQPLPEFLRVTRTVKNGQNGKLLVFDCEVYAVARKPLQTNYASLLTSLRESFWICLRTFQRALELQAKFLSQAWALVFIPDSGFSEFETSLWFVSDPQTHFQPKRSLSSASTCSKGIPPCGLASKLARRRSSSAACSGVSSGSCPSSAMMSQKSCASLSLSSCGRTFAASRISVALMFVIYRDGRELQAGISGDGFVKFAPCERFESDVAAHGQLYFFFASARTCSQGMQSSGFFKASWARRSNSAINSGDSSDSKSSKRASAISRRSSGRNSRALAKMSVALMPGSLLENLVVGKLQFEPRFKTEFSPL